MSHWNYRVILHAHPTDSAHDWFGIHEVHYNDKSEINSISVDPIAPCGDTMEELDKDMLLMKQAFTMGFLDYDNCVFAGVTDEEAEEIDGHE